VDHPRATIGPMEFGLVLPTMPAGASTEGIEAAAEVAERLGWRDVWTTDHVLVERDSAKQYGRIYEAVSTLAYVAGLTKRVRLGTSVIVVPQRNAVVLAKVLATIDSLSRGRLIVGVGVGWDEKEFANIGVADRFRVRGRYLDESIALWRHLWSGSSEPFEGESHRFDDFVFEPLPDQGAALPIWVGGGSRAALERAGRLGDAYHASMAGPDKYAERIPVVREAAEAAGRPMPLLSARVRLIVAQRAGSIRPRPGTYVMAGTYDEIRAEIGRFAELGVEHMILGFGTTNAEELVRAVERFDDQVVRGQART
jgi:probable F420-dependent oxidoreductase